MGSRENEAEETKFIYKTGLLTTRNSKYALYHCGRLNKKPLYSHFSV